MKWSCAVIQDLIPLYQDECCSGESRKVVEEHIGECAECRKLLEDMGREIEHIPDIGHIAETGPDANEEKRMKRSFRKIHRLWRHRLAAAVLGSFVLFVSVVLGVHEFMGSGIAFTNLDEIWRTQRFLSYIRRGDYERAAGLTGYSGEYQSMLDSLSETDAGERYYRDCFTEIIWDGESFMISDYLAGLTNAERGEDIWAYMAENQMTQAVIPEKIWEKEAEEHPEEMRLIIERSPYYVRVELKWGVYYVGDSLYRLILNEGEEAVSAYDVYSYCGGIMPTEIYREAEADILAEDKRLVQWREEKFGTIRGLSKEEYGEIMRRKLVQSLKQWENEGGRLDSFSFSSANRGSGGWEIGMSVTAKKGSGEGNHTLHTSFEGRFIDGVRASWPGDTERADDHLALENALQVYYFDSDSAD